MRMNKLNLRGHRGNRGTEERSFVIVTSAVSRDVTIPMASEDEEGKGRESRVNQPGSLKYLLKFSNAVAIMQ